jgi:beta-glucosidase/6-phospho-beta-glucosidase/beta-galactosidase/glycosyltransferase involved in cell wall biosynthesis
MSRWLPGRRRPLPPLEFIGAFESTYQPAFDVDVLETTGHVERWRDDLELLAACGVRRLRYPIRWHRIEVSPGVYDWRFTDEVLGYLRDRGFRPIVDLLHHTSYPAWLSGFTDARFVSAFAGFVEAFARRYSHVDEYTLVNEPFTTVFLCGHEGLWAPHLTGLDGFLAVLRTLLPATLAADDAYRAAVPGARHVWVDVAERHTWEGPGYEAAHAAALANDRRFFVLDAYLGRHLDEHRPFVRQILEAGGEDLLMLPRGRIDVLGLDYYAHNQWHYKPGGAVRSSPLAPPLSKLILEYWRRYRLPCILGETNIRGFPSDRATWLKYTLEQCELARQAGVPLEGYCWFPFIDSADWASELCRCDRQIDPVGIYWLDENLERRPSSMSRAYAAAARGTPAAELPAYELQDPVDSWLAGWRPHMSHWQWIPAPADETRPAHHPPTHPVADPSTSATRGAAPPMPTTPELVVLSHLRWVFVWQRPQHIISRLAAHHRTWFVEEPLATPGVTDVRLRTEQHGAVTRVWLEVPGPERHVGFEDPVAAAYPELLAAHVGAADVEPRAYRTTWLYTPMALELARAVGGDRLVYDVMDDLAAFKGAPRELRLRQAQVLNAADVVFTGGRSLHRSVVARRPAGTHLFPSGVEPEHFAAARRARMARQGRARPVAGYVGVIDERLELELLAGLAAALPDWDIDVVGPVVKIDAASLPAAPNLHYPGPRPYAELPDVMGGFDVGLMPFALNEATRSISPTKTLEYLAAGLAVVSTRVPDVVADYDGIVDLADDAAGFAAACRASRAGLDEGRAARVEAVLHRQHWDTIAARMHELMTAEADGREATEEETA